MLISKYGFMDVLENSRVVVDPSRVAAQVVSGIGLIGGGVIFMRRDVVRGLTTAASVWLTAALGMACGAGLPVLAVATTVLHLIIMFVFPKLTRKLSRKQRAATRLRICYEDGRGLLRSILVACTELRFAIDRVSVERESDSSAAFEEAQDLADAEGIEARRPGRTIVALSIEVKGKRPVSHLIARLTGIDGITQVGTVDDSDPE